MDRNYKGDDYEVDQKLRDGPMTDRKCTDCLFLILFLAFMGVFGWVCVLGFENDPQVLLSPLDWDRKLCGVVDKTTGDDSYQKYGKLYFTAKLKTPVIPGVYEFDYYATCVSKCPTEEEKTVDCHSNAKVSQETCAQAATETNPGGHIAYGTKNILDKFCLPLLSSTNVFFNSTDVDNLVGTFGVDDIQQYYEDIIDAKMVYLYCMSSCLVITVLYNVFLKCFARLLVWLTIIITGIFLVAGSYFLTMYHKKHYV